MNCEHLMAVKNLSYVRHHRRIIQNVNFSVKCGECIVFTGANGTGKSTTLNILAGLLKPTSGHVHIHQLNVHQLPLLAKQWMGFLPDKPPLYHELTVSEYLQLAAKLRQIPKVDRVLIINQTLQTLGLTHHHNHLIGTLSKGQQQRVGIAQAILHRPKLLLLDEPTQGLDPDQIESFLNMLHEYKKHSAIILSSHNFLEVEFLCDRRLQFTHQGIKEYDRNDCPA